MRWFILYLLPVAIWMIAIFSASGDGASFQHSSRIIEPFLHWLFPKMPPETAMEIVFVCRKCAHLTEYAILALLVWRARRRLLWPDGGSWSWSTAGVALWVAVLYAATDEYHQTFIPSREGCLRDVFIDSSGAVAGLVLLWILGRWRKVW